MLYEHPFTDPHWGWSPDEESPGDLGARHYGQSAGPRTLQVGGQVGLNWNNTVELTLKCREESFFESVEKHIDAEYQKNC